MEKSLAAIPANRSTRAGLAELGEPEIEATLARVTRNKNGHATEADDDTTPTAPSTLSVGGSTGDGQRFRLLRPHARGGLGEVFVALDAELHREVALKQILEKHADDPVSRQRFVAEAEITGGLEHPGIVPVYGLGTYGGGRPYYAMRFIKGDSLKEAIEQFHADDVPEERPRPSILGAAQAAPPLPRRLQRHRLRPLPRRDPSRHQAGQHHPGQARRDAGGRLGAGQGRGPGRSVGRRADHRAVVERVIGDHARQCPGHAGLHEPRAGLRRSRPAGPALRRLLAGRHPVLPADRQAAVRGRRRRRDPPQGAAG